MGWRDNRVESGMRFNDIGVIGLSIQKRGDLGDDLSLVMPVETDDIGADHKQSIIMGNEFILQKFIFDFKLTPNLY